VTRRTSQALRLSLALVLAAVLAGCGSGGFAGVHIAEPTVVTRNYVALGDGFSSAPYLSTDTSTNGCLRSNDNYPSLVAHKLAIIKFTDVTCFGATSKSMTSPSRAPKGSTQVAAQLDAVTKDTDLVTFGAGIEDENILQTMFHVCTAEPCGTDVLGPALLKYVVTLGTTLTNQIRSIQAVAPTATIVVVGYPQIMPPTGLCNALPQITDTQLGYANAVLSQLNAQLLSAAQQTGGTFIDVAGLSTDHTACSNVPWVNGDKTVKGKFAAFHPTAAEQTAIANAIVTQIRTPS
jgi:hypothetical protein